MLKPKLKCKNLKTITQNLKANADLLISDCKKINALGWLSEIFI